ncbi:MAG: arginase family protein [Candidatus Aenigmarchaeota archaeon]|nr:arginase family protein [Candidatus Aenigmarchaeota archaeon]
MRFKLFGVDCFEKDEANVIVLGLDYTKDSKKVLKNLRKWSTFTEPFDLLEKKNLLENVRIHDIGDVRLEEIEEVVGVVKEIRDTGKVPLIISRGHLPTLFISRVFKEEKLLVFDAHADCKDRYMDEIIKLDSCKDREKFNGTTWLRRLMEGSRKEVLVMGVRSLDQDELSFLREKEIKFISSFEIKNDRVFETLKEFSKRSRIYVSLDVDVFDPSICPSVDYPEPEGILMEDFRRIVRNLEGEIVGLDVCCFNAAKEDRLTGFTVSKALSLLLSRLKNFYQ